MVTLITKVTERGQASIPSAVRKQLAMRTGTRLVWEPVSDREVRVSVQPEVGVEGPRSVLGYAKSFRKVRRTSDWMTELREGERT